MGARARGPQALQLNEFNLLLQAPRCTAARWLILGSLAGVLTGFMASPEQTIDDDALPEPPQGRP